MPRSATPPSQAPDTEATEPVDDGQRRRRSGPALNRVELIGRLAADPDLRYTSAGIPVYVIWNLIE